MNSDPAPMLDLNESDDETVEFLLDYFRAKSRKDPVATIAFFADDALTYTDAPLGWATQGKAGISESFTSVMPHWGEGASYPTAIFGSFAGGSGSALVSFTNTPGIVGNELLRILAAVDVRGGKIVRWIDYWDTSTIDEAFREQVRAPAEGFPDTYGEDQLTPVGLGAVGAVAVSLQQALGAGDSTGSADLFDDDATWDDRTLGVRIVGRNAIERYFERSTGVSPVGPGAHLRHVVGRGNAGGYEWIGAPSSGVLSGITGLTLTARGRISSSVSVYDGRLLAPGSHQQLITWATRAR